MNKVLCSSKDCGNEFVVEDNIYEYDDRMMKCPECGSHQQIPRAVIIERLLPNCAKTTKLKMEKELEEMKK